MDPQRVKRRESAVMEQRARGAIDRAGGWVTITPDESRAVAERFGGHLRISLVGEQASDGTWTLRPVSKPIEPGERPAVRA